MAGFVSALLVSALLGGAAAPAFAAEAHKPVEVMIVGVTHLANPGHDNHNLQVDDVLQPRRQREITAITDALARFKPTRIGVEWPENLVVERYGQYLAGSLPPSRNEVVQLGFRLAKIAGAEGVYSLDADGDFPYERVQNFAETRGFKPLLDAQNAVVEEDLQEARRILADKSVGALLRHLNELDTIVRSNGFYRSMLKVGLKSDQPGVDLVSAWYRRNLQICANLLQLAKPGDRVVVFFGVGHALLLRQCVAETPGYRLVEPNAYLPG